MCGLHFPNGLQITKQGDILVAETTRFRIIKINISAVQDPAPSDDKELRRMRSQFNAIRHTTCHGRPEIPAFSSIDDYLFPTDDSFPTEETGLSIFIDALPGAPDNIRENPINHHITIGLGVKSTKPFSLLHFAYQHIGIRHLIGKLIPMRYLEHLVPKYGLVLVSKSDGTPVDSYHDPSGRISMISEAQFHPVTGDLWMGSHSNEFIGVDRVNKDKARIQSILSEQDVEMERYYVENRAIFKSWKEQEDKEQLERMRYLESNQ